jgi:hypothetical protein
MAGRKKLETGIVDLEKEGIFMPQSRIRPIKPRQPMPEIWRFRRNLGFFDIPSIDNF